MGPEVRATGRATFTVRDEWEFLPALLRPTTATGHSCQHTVRQQEPHTPNLRKTNLSEDRRSVTWQCEETQRSYGLGRGEAQAYLPALLRQSANTPTATRLLPLGSGQSNKVLQAHLRHALLRALLRLSTSDLRLPPVPSQPVRPSHYGACYVCACCVPRAAMLVLLRARRLRAAVPLSDHVHDSCSWSYLRNRGAGSTTSAKSNAGVW